MEKRDYRGNFTEVFRRFFVLEVESGKKTLHDLNVGYGIQGHSTILKWCRKYGDNQYPMKVHMTKEGSPSLKENEALLLRNQVKVLERELRESQLKQATLETLFDIAERHYSIRIKKTLVGSNRSNDARAINGKRILQEMNSWT